MMQKLLLLVLVFKVLPAFGHDIGVTEVEFRELPDHKYELTITTMDNVDEITAQPLLPEKCRVNATENSLQIKPIFSIQCSAEGFTASDAIILPWRRDAVLVHATWL